MAIRLFGTYLDPPVLPPLHPMRNFMASCAYRRECSLLKIFPGKKVDGNLTVNIKPRLELRTQARDTQYRPRQIPHIRRNFIEVEEGVAITCALQRVVK